MLKGLNYAKDGASQSFRSAAHARQTQYYGPQDWKAQVYQAQDAGLPVPGAKKKH